MNYDKHMMVTYTDEKVLVNQTALSIWDNNDETLIFIINYNRMQLKYVTMLIDHLSNPQ